MVNQLPAEYTAQLSRLRMLLSGLPKSIPSSEGIYYPFSNFQIDEEWAQETGSLQGAINHALEIAFGSRGSRIASGELPVVFEYRGYDLECVVDVLSTYLTGDRQLDTILLKWVDDLIASAEPLVERADAPTEVLEGSSSGRVRRATHKQKVINKAAAIEAARKEQREETRRKEERALARTEFKVNYDPEKLTDVPSKRSVSGRGKNPSPLLEKLTIPCRDENGKLRVRCSGLGCPYNWKAPRQSRNVLPHARVCQFLSDTLREEAREGLRVLAPSAQLAELDKILADNAEDSLHNPGGLASVLEDHLTTKRKLVGEDLLVRCLCDNFLPPTLVDSDSFKAYVDHLDPQTKLAHSSTYVKLITAEAEAALEASVLELVQQTHLTMSFDGASIRGAQSIYTIHVTSPETRQAHLIEGNEASGRSHTAAHIKGVLENTHKLAWIKDNIEFRQFEETLRQLHGLLQPFARAVVCLEASSSTLGDVYYLWIAAQAALNSIFIDSNHLGGLMLPNKLILDVRTLVNGRYAQAIDEPELRCYLATFYLDHRYLGSDIFKRKHANPLSTTITINSHQNNTTYVSGSNSSSALYDDDIRRSMPAYLRVGQYLIPFLTHEVNSKRAPHIFGLYKTWDAIVDAFRMQFIAYTRQHPPFDNICTTDTPLEYWTKLLDRSEARVLAWLAIKLFSIVPNSMAEERTISAFTKLNSPDRGRQKAQTVVSMTQVLQQERRKRSGTLRLPLTTFRDIPDLVSATDRPVVQMESDSGGLELAIEHTDDAVDDNFSQASPSWNDHPAVQNEDDESRSMETPAEWENFAGLDEELESAPTSRHCEEFETTQSDGIDLTSPYLLGVLTDKLLPELLVTRAFPLPVVQPVEQAPVVRAVVVPF
ncbi:hypothetical protein FRC07_006894 [Ceratobasidium sp. 392]|nr:hypothetical protein FRC07_006894 [Ceratobasidium sp. 392]